MHFNDQVRKAANWPAGFPHAQEAAVAPAQRQWEVMETTLPEKRHLLVGRVGAGGGWGEGEWGLAGEGERTKRARRMQPAAAVAAANQRHSSV